MEGPEHTQGKHCLSLLLILLQSVLCKQPSHKFIFVLTSPDSPKWWGPVCSTNCNYFQWRGKNYFVCQVEAPQRMSQNHSLLLLFPRLLSVWEIHHFAVIRINICFNMELQMRGSDTSTAESGSEADDSTSPKALRSYISHPKLTPVREEVSIWSFPVLCVCHQSCSQKPITFLTTMDYPRWN